MRADSKAATIRFGGVVEDAFTYGELKDKSSSIDVGRQRLNSKRPSDKEQQTALNLKALRSIDLTLVS